MRAMIVLGDINVDMIARVRAWPRPGQDCLSKKLELRCGGVGANCALALARWGVTVRLAGCVGRDRFGDFLAEILKKGGVDVRWIQRTAEAVTGIFYINVTRDGQRTFFGCRGANGHVGRLEAAQRLCRGAQVAHLVGYNFLDAGTRAAARQLIRAIRRQAGIVSLDVGNEPSLRIPKAILRAGRDVDILFASGDEAEALTGTRDMNRAIERLVAAGPECVVLKLGKRGCWIAESGRVLRVPPFPVRTIDSTGAGDAFVAGFLQARLRGWPLAEAGLAANAAGAAAATLVGAGESLPGIEEAARVLRRQRLGIRWEAARKRTLRRLEALRGERGGQR